MTLQQLIQLAKDWAEDPMVSLEEWTILDEIICQVSEDSMWMGKNW